MILLDDKNNIKVGVSPDESFETQEGRVKLFDTFKENKALFWFDSETSGLDSKTNQVLTISFVVSDIFFKVLDRISLNIKPIEGLVMDAGAMEVNKLDVGSKEFLDSALTELEALKRIEGFIRRHQKEYNTLIAHNAKFDKGFLEAMIVRTGYPNFLDSLNLVDTLPFFRKLINSGELGTRTLVNKKGQKYKSSKLEDIAESLGIVNEKAHDSLEDTLTLIKVFQKALLDYEHKSYFTVYTGKYDRFSSFKELLLFLKKENSIIEVLNQNLDLMDEIMTSDLEIVKSGELYEVLDFGICYDLEIKVWRAV